MGRKLNKSRCKCISWIKKVHLLILIIQSQKNLKSFNNGARFRQRTISQDLESPTLQQFYYPRPELKPNYSTETRYTTNSNANDIGFAMDYNFYPLDNTRQQHQRQNGYLPPSANSNNNPFAPIGYSCQRSTSLLPSIGSHRSSSSNSSSMNGNHHHNNNHMDYASNDLKSSPAFGTYPLYNMSPASRSGMGSIAAHDHYMMNNRLYSLESKDL